MQKHGKMQLTCIIVGDFNTTIFPNEKKEGFKFSDSFGERLEDFMNPWRVIDIKPRKGPNTPGVIRGLDQVSLLSD